MCVCVCVRLLAGGCERQRLNGPQPNGLKVYTNDCVEEKREEKSHTQRPFLKSRLFSSAKKKTDWNSALMSLLFGFDYSGR